MSAGVYAAVLDICRLDVTDICFDLSLENPADGMREVFA
jgi:hypothetical protein